MGNSYNVEQEVKKRQKDEDLHDFDDSYGASLAIKRKNFPSIKKLPVQSKAALEFYSGSGSEAINAVLRGTYNANDFRNKIAENLDELRYEIRLIRGSFRRVDPVINDTIVYRFMENCSFLEQFGPGDKFTIDGFISTSIDSTVVRTLMVSHNIHSCVMVIKIPKGAKALYIRQISDVEDEEEVLLPHASVFLVKDVSKVSVNRENDQVFFFEPPNDKSKTILVLTVDLIGEPDLLPKISLDFGLSKLTLEDSKSKKRKNEEMEIDENENKMKKINSNEMEQD